MIKAVEFTALAVSNKQVSQMNALLEYFDILCALSSHAI